MLFDRKQIRAQQVTLLLPSLQLMQMSGAYHVNGMAVFTARNRLSSL